MAVGDVRLADCENERAGRRDARYNRLDGRLIDYLGYRRQLLRDRVNAGMGL